MMKNITIKQIILFLFVGMISFSCSQDTEETPGNEPLATGEGIPIVTTFDTKVLPTGLQCNMHIFWKDEADGDEEYAFKETIVLSNTETNKIKFMNNELTDKSYRFLFIATPVAKEIELLKNDESALTAGVKWEDIMIHATKQLISANNYQGFVDKTGQEILDDKTIKGTLTRVVGQVLFDIYKVLKTGNTTESLPVEMPHYTVLDRVYQIDIEYSNMTQGAVYNTTNELVHHSVFTPAYKQTIYPVLFENQNPWFPNFKVDVTQPVDSLEFSKEKQGSAHIRGIFCMPSDHNMKIKMTYYYYDTTPLCPGEEHTHSSLCYSYIDENNMRVYLPTICGIEEHIRHSAGYPCHINGELVCTKPLHHHRTACYDVAPLCGKEEYFYTRDCFKQKSIVLNLPKENSTALSIIPNHYTVNTAKIRYDRIIDVGVNFSFEFDTAWDNDSN